MSTPANEHFWALTEKQKETLRLIVRGHDAKSIERRLGLSVHTINERLRDARRKMSVSSSREAARLLAQAEGENLSGAIPQSLADKRMGDDAAGARSNQESAQIGGAERATRSLWILIGVFLMTFTLGLMALASLSPFTAVPAPAALRASPDAQVVNAARSFLELLDRGRWEESYRASGTAFRKLNTLKIWAKTSQKVRAPLGAATSRTFVSQENLPAPPMGYEVVKFRTRFERGGEMIETVTLEREDGAWRVVGVTVG